MELIEELAVLRLVKTMFSFALIALYQQRKKNRLTQEIQKLTIKNAGELLTSKAKTRNITEQCTRKFEGAFLCLFK
jgi:hypothetical protein